MKITKSFQITIKEHTNLLFVSYINSILMKHLLTITHSNTEFFVLMPQYKSVSFGHYLTPSGSKLKLYKHTIAQNVNDMMVLRLDMYMCVCLT